MIDFKKIELVDRDWMKPLIAAADMRACHQNFINIFAWSEINNYRVARLANYLIVKGKEKDYDRHYFYPVGSGDIQEVIKTLIQDANDSDHEFKLLGISPENINELNNIFPGRFEYSPMRDSFDYIYQLDKLVTLAGNKLHSKRNHINKFKKVNNWSFELITPGNLVECWEMNIKWCKDNNCNEDDQLLKEKCAVKRCFDNYVELGLEGGLLRVDERVIAFTMGEKLNSDTYVIHVEKAFSEIQGAYQMINREFSAYVQQTHPELLYINREEDMGYEGLRKAKLSYYPEKLEEKYIAKLSS